MPAINTTRSLSKALILLTSLFVGAQLVFLFVSALTSKMFDTAVASSITAQILHSKIFITGVAQLLVSQLLIYAGLIYLVWYTSTALGEQFALRQHTTYRLGLIVLITSFVFILSANYCLAPHSFFANLMRDNFFHDHLDDLPVRYFYFLSGWILLAIGCLASTHLLFSLFRRQHLIRHTTMLVLLSGLVLITGMNTWLSKPTPINIATTEKPNIIIIGIDAVRPDFVGFYNKAVTHTPNIDAFLKSGIHFSNAYTALPRTFPSWTSILTGTYPIHNHARGNNIDLAELNLQNTLPKILQQQGYETIYSTDDTRFNNTNELLGFDRVITPPMGLNDFLIGTMNDFPLSNLLVPTAIGRLLFPYNYANHGTPITYSPNNFLQLLNQTLSHRQHKPLFIAVHLTMTHWPFYWFNDHLSSICQELCRYQAGIAAADTQMAAVMNSLQANKLLDHAIVILLSDHGTAMGLPGDRMTAADHYQGNKNNIKQLSVMKYSGTPDQSTDYQHDYGVDTSYGYGGDILSMKQYHALLAFQGYGINIGQPHDVQDRVLLMDIAPTLLELLKLSPLANTDGISLQPYLLNTYPGNQSNQRPLFLESSFTLEEIEKEGISAAKVLEKTAKLYRMDPKTGLVFIKRDAERGMNQNKQQAILQGDWLLAHLPEAAKNRLVATKNGSTLYEAYIIPPRFVLINMKTKNWTLELDTHFAHTAPLQSLKNQLDKFYGAEVTNRPPT